MIFKSHEEYEEFSARWELCKSFALGDEHEVKELKESVLPKFVCEQGGDGSQYKTRLNNAHLNNMTASSLTIFTGMIFRKPPIIISTPEMDEYLDNIDGKGTGIINFAKKLVIEEIVKNRYGILINSTPAQEGENQAEYKSRGGKTFLSPYCAESIVDWAEKDGKLAYVALKEEEESVAFIDGKFEKSCEDVFITLDILEENGKYRFMKWKKQGQATEFEAVETIELPLRADGTMPFDIYPSIEPEISMIMGLVNANKHHFMVDSLQSYISAVIAIPTPVLRGASNVNQNPNDAPVINLGQPIAFNEPSGDFRWAEVSGGGIGATINYRLEMLHNEMVSQGASALQDQKLSAETAASKAISSVGENSVLAEISQSVSSALTKSVNDMFAVAGIQGEFSITLNKDMLPYPMTPDQISVFMEAHTQKKITNEVFIHNMQKAEIYPDNYDVTPELNLLQSSEIEEKSVDDTKYDDVELPQM
jgi:hypothetical protein